MPNQFPHETSNKYLASYYKRLQWPDHVPPTVPIYTILACACNAYIESVRLNKPSGKM